MLNKLVCLLALVVMSASPVLAEKAAMEVPRPTAHFPIGVFAVSRDLLYLAKMKGFEVVHNYRFEESRDKNDELAAYLDEAHKLGLKVMVGFERKENYTISKVVERVCRFRAHPALWAWFLYDEPKPEMRDRVQEIATAIRREDAGHPMIIAANEAEFAILAGTIFAYKYPIKDQSFPREDLNPLVRRIDQAAAVGIPFYGLIQTFNWNRYWKFEKMRRDNRLPTIEELRFMAFYGVIRGAQGVFFFSFQTLPVEDENLSHVVTLTGELKRVREYLVGNQVDPKQYIENPYAKAWRKEGDTLLLITNPSGQTVETTLNTGPWALGDFKNPKAMIPSGKLTLKPWDVRLLLVNEKVVP